MIGTFKTALTEVTSDSNRADVLGSIRFDSGKFYKYVMLKNVTATVAAVAGDPCVYKASTGYAANQVVVDSTDGDTQPIGAGFLLATITGTAGTAYYCWIQLSGLVVVPLAVTTGVIGSGCMPTTSSGTDKTLVVATGVINSMGILHITSATNNTVLATCPF